MSLSKKDKPIIVRTGIFNCQVCVPKDWTDAQATQFVNAQNPAGTSSGWTMRKNGDKLLVGMPERAQCLAHEGCVHIMFDC